MVRSLRVGEHGDRKRALSVAVVVSMAFSLLSLGSLPGSFAAKTSTKAPVVTLESEPLAVGKYGLKLVVTQLPPQSESKGSVSLQVRLERKSGQSTQAHGYTFPLSKRNFRLARGLSGRVEVASEMGHFGKLDLKITRSSKPKDRVDDQGCKIRSAKVLLSGPLSFDPGGTLKPVNKKVKLRAVVSETRCPDQSSAPSPSPTPDQSPTPDPGPGLPTLPCLDVSAIIIAGIGGLGSDDMPEGGISNSTFFATALDGKIEERFSASESEAPATISRTVSASSEDTSLVEADDPVLIQAHVKGVAPFFEGSADFVSDPDPDNLRSTVLPCFSADPPQIGTLTLATRSGSISGDLTAKFDLGGDRSVEYESAMMLKVEGRTIFP